MKKGQVKEKLLKDLRRASTMKKLEAVVREAKMYKLHEEDWFQEAYLNQYQFLNGTIDVTDSFDEDDDNGKDQNEDPVDIDCDGQSEKEGPYKAGGFGFHSESLANLFNIGFSLVDTIKSAGLREERELEA